ncbi:dynein axonemal intermediate chain 7 [Sardina pilchardus]|uniref:dynein axonemal intermediate chain 7 n=1 Tax=Sardina pilchardus TaxID=27697 RepID=UPI002E0DF722
MSGKKKGGKLSKAEKERLQREEDERKHKEEEEARLVAEREEQERRERQLQEQEVQERLELKDKERREDELNELRHLLEENQAAVTKWESESREKAKWERYMRCDGSPDPSVLQEINTFITLWREDPESQVKPILQQCDLALRLIDELEGLLADQPEPQEAIQHKETLQSLQELILVKQNLITEGVLKLANTQADIETGNMQTVIQDKNVTLCLWANLNKNPRFKGFEFQEVQLGFRLPKQLAVGDVAVRILHTRYDHLSHLSRPVPPRSRSSLASIGAGGDQEPQDPEDTPAATETEGEGEGGGSVHPGEEAEVMSLKSEGRKSAVSIQSVKEDRKSAALKPVDEHGNEPDETETMVEGIDSGEGGSPPPTVDPVADSLVASIVDLHQLTSLGGVFYFDALHLPPQAHALNGWEIRQLLDTGLQVFPYPSEQAPLHSSTTGRLDESAALSCPPVGVSVKLPDAVIFLEDPQVARWDPTDQHWKTDCISDVSYDAEAKSVTFNMDAFYAFTLMQDMYANMPFQDWELRPLAQDSALLTITGALIDVRITIKGDQCMLQTEQERAPAHLLDRWMSAPALQAAMTGAGINIFTSHHSDKYVSVNAKDPLIEHTVYEQMALLSSAVAFAWSRWNAQCGQEHLVLKVCEQLEAEAVREDAWSLYLLGAQRSQRLAMGEDAASFGPQLAPHSEFHSTFLHMLLDGMSAAAEERVRAAHHLHVETVQRLLCATRVLTYS